MSHARVNGDNTSGSATALSSANSRRQSIHGGTSTQLVPPVRVAPVLSTTQANHLITNDGDHAGEADTIEHELRKVPIQQMFGDNVLVHGGQFMIMISERVASNPERTGFKLLIARVSTSASHNSAQWVDPPRCHPDTRVAILQKIYDWITQSEGREEWILWLNGAAGAGKSAIIQSIAEHIILAISEQCVEVPLAIASFFFFRPDSTRNTMASLITTLAYQLIQAIPGTLDEILTIIERNPMIFDQSLELQLQQLLIQPLLHLPTNLQCLFVVFIDGLDECNNRAHQSSLINLLGKLSSAKNIPVVFIVASRREPQIEAAFRRKQLSDLVQILPLDNSDIEQASEDIRHFLTDKFDEIKETHLRKHLLSSDWPLSSNVEEIVAKSSGQFIYASVVVNFISSPHAHPALQLDVIKGIRPRSHSANPFAHLDALYQYIFSQVEDLAFVLNVLGFQLVLPKNSWPKQIKKLELLCQLASGELEVYFADLTAVIECEPHTKDDARMKFLHASLPDFLLDKSRSEEYHIDLDEYRTKLLCMFLERPPPVLDPLSPTHSLDVVLDQEYWRLGAIWTLLMVTKASDRLQAAYISFNVAFHCPEMANKNSVHFPEVLDYLKPLNLNDQGQAYRHVVDIFAMEYAKYWPSLDHWAVNNVRSSPDLLARIGQIRQEEL